MQSKYCLSLVLGLSIYDEIPNYSTWSQNYIRRYKESNVFDKIFETILNQAIKYKFIDCETVFGDGTHQKANANKNKHQDVEVEIAKKVYEDKLLEEINEDRIKHGKKPIEDITKKEVMFDEETGELKENIETKHIKESLTDLESGCFHKGEKEKCFAYTECVSNSKKITFYLFVRLGIRLFLYKNTWHVLRVYS